MFRFSSVGRQQLICARGRLSCPVAVAGTLVAMAVSFVAAVHATADDSDSPISSRVEVTDAGERVLIQEASFDASVSDLWKAYVTEEGWGSWASPVVEIDLRAGGTIHTHYDANAKIGDPGTNTLHILNYVPERVLTLRAELQDNWPEVMKQDHGRLMNVVLFDPLPEGGARVRSYGVGYSDTPEYDELMQFFIRGNEGLLAKLKSYVEDDPNSP